jgi:hypothetical protein
MIDIHPPHHAATTRRDFFIHLSTVVLGILIAIGLEQTVEYLHHRHLATEARRSLLAERVSNETSNDLNIFATRRHQRDLQQDLAALHALRAHQPLPTGPFIVHHVHSLYFEDEWHKIHQSGTINYLAEELRPIEYRYELQDAFTDLINRSNEDLSRAASVLRTQHDPLNTTFENNVSFFAFRQRLEDSHETLSAEEVDRGFAALAEPTNLPGLSPAQIDSLERALQIALADDDTLLTYCYNIKRNLANNPQH